ncbi:Membrane protein OS=Streptomyces glaucescens OX=1907 GN=SGLAU_10190 PE=4 SV=1 [Streptomyces glaucescens]
MGSAKNSTSAARKARIEEMRKAEQARERRNRILTVTASFVVVAGLVAGTVFLVHAQSDDSSTDAKATAGEVRHRLGRREDVEGDAGSDPRHQDREVPDRAPGRRDHHQAWMNCNGDVYTKALNNMNAVHSLEHGAVWVTYNSKASKRTSTRSRRR